MEKRDIKAIQKWIEPRFKEIADARNDAVRAGGRPRVMYIGDILPHKKDELRISPMNRDSECKVFGMKIVVDFRVPKNTFYLTYGELNDGRAQTAA